MLMGRFHIKRVFLFVGAILLAGTSLFVTWDQYSKTCSNEKQQLFIKEMVRTHVYNLGVPMVPQELCIHNRMCKEQRFRLFDFAISMSLLKLPPKNKIANCSMYYNRTIVGNLCSKVCDEEDNFSYDHCGSNHNRKNVIILRCKNCHPHRPNIRVVLKSYYDMSDWEHHADLNIAMNKRLEDIVSTVRSRIIRRANEAFNIDLSKHSDLMSFMWNENFYEFMQKANFDNAGKIAALNILGLGLQSEYISLKYLKNQSYMPKLYGTCGTAYFVEYTPSLVRLGYVLFQSTVPDTLHFHRQFPSWTERTIVALRLLQLVRTLDTKQESPLYNCDIGPRNLGLHGEDEIALLDTDSIKFGMTAKACDSDLDCKWQDCERTCNMNSRTCLHNIKNSHLQIICDQVFISGFSWFGLLRNPPRRIVKDLREVLQECAHPSNYGTNVTLKRSSEEVLNKLESILLSSL